MTLKEVPDIRRKRMDAQQAHDLSICPTHIKGRCVTT